MGARQASPVALRVGPIGVKVYGIELKHDEKYSRTARDHFLLPYAVYLKQTAHLEMISITWHLKWILTTLKLITIATGDDYKLLQ